MINIFSYFSHMKIKMVITDFDGTLLNSRKIVSINNRYALELLGKEKICRVIATGRNLYSLNKVINNDFPVDYVVFSSGCGLLNWKTKEIIFQGNLDSLTVKHISNIFINDNLDFMCHEIVPNNHYFFYHHDGNDNHDFFRRLELYKNYSKKITRPIEHESSQFLVVFPENSNKINQYKNILDNVNIIRTTSPLDHKSVWMEIFHKEISKSKTCQRLCDILGIDRKFTLGIGNDYNDIDLLKWSEQSFVVENAPEEMKFNFNNTLSNDKDGFSSVINEMILKRY